MSTTGSRLGRVAALALALLAFGGRAAAVRPEGGSAGTGAPAAAPGKPLDEPDPAAKERIFRRRQLLAAMQRAGGLAQVGALDLEARALARVGSDRILVVLVEFAGTDTFTWTEGQSTWDPLGKTSAAEVVRDGSGAVVAGDCSLIIGETTTFTYSGPLHNRIERPLSAEDRSGTMIWTPDFSAAFYDDLILGSGVAFDYQRQDGSSMSRSFVGRSVRDYYEDMSAGRYTIAGDVVGWVQVPHSVWWYGADQCPGARSADSSTAVWTSGAIPGAGTSKTLVIDALEAVKAAYPAFDWASYDANHDGVIDRLWIIHAGLGEEDANALLDRTDYGEAQIWSHASSLSPDYEVVPGVRAGPYIVMPENAGMGVLAHEFAHNLGADDLYSYGRGDTSAGFWTVMSDDWTGHPIGFQPPAFDPWHLDGWGWLDPKVISDPTQSYTVKVGQASEFAGGADVYRGVKIVLPDQQAPLPVAPRGTQQWWGGAESLIASTMTLRSPIAIPAGGATLSFALAYRTEAQWDWLWVQASEDGGATWRTLTNAHTRCDHDPAWIGGRHGFPADLCAAGIGGFTGASASFPALATESFSLAPFAGKSVVLRLFYMTDWATLDAGVFVDDVAVKAGAATLLSDGAETQSGLWGYAGAWARVGAARTIPHAYYLQWRNVSGSGGYDSALGDPLWRYGPANSGLLVWYNNDRYTDNEIEKYLNDPPGFGPKGRMLVLDAHPEPYRSPAWTDQGYDNEAANATNRQQMRDAPFSIHATVPFTLWGESYDGRAGVDAFADELSYYPGAQFVPRGPGYSPPELIWDTRQWDASAVVPSRVAYGIDAPGYLAADPLAYACFPSGDGLATCSWFPSGLGYDGGAGAPVVAGGAYGWKVEIESESDGQATLRIYNDLAACVLTCEAAVPEFAQVGVAAPFSVADRLTGCSGAISRAWEFGDGSAGATGASATHAYAQGGAFAWRVSVTGAGQSCSRSGTITVGSGPDVAVAQGGAAIADGQAAAVSFGSVPRGVRGPTRVFSVTNRGDIPLVLGAVAVPAGYTLVEPLARELPPWGVDTFTVRLESAAAGTRGGQVSFATNQTGANPFDFPVTGTVSAPLSKFDFGTATSPVQSGYTRVAAGARYTASAGYGWQSGTVAARDRASGSSLRRDFAFSPLAAFAVDLPDGTYLATVTMGDAASGHDLMGVSLEGEQVGVATTAAGQFWVRTFRAVVADGRLDLQLRDLGGKDANAVINALDLTPVATRFFDFGTASSPLAAGRARVTPATRYTASLGYGWAAGSVECRDRASGSALARDFNFGPLATFVVDLPNGAYDVVVTTGDWSGAHDLMGVTIEGTKVDTITTAARECLTRVYRTAVADSRLTVLLDDLGGADANVVVNGLEVWPAAATRFDFGTDTSPVEAGYARVTAAAAYSPWLGHGWLLGARDARDRGRGSALTRDLVFSPFAVFLLDLLPGTWDLAVTMGDAAALHDMMAIAVDGVRLDTFGTPANQFHAQTYRAGLGGDPVTVGIEDLGGSDGNAVINGLAAARVGAFKGDFGTATSPVEAGWTRVAHTTRYSAALGHGWLAGTIGSRDRATGTALRRDINVTSLGTFAVDVPAGTYDVTITLGDAAARHDEVGVYLEGARVDTVTTAKNQFNATTHRVAVADGQLTVVLDDLGGSDLSAAIAAVEVR